MHRLPLVGLSLVGVSFAIGTEARAEFVQWSFSTSASPILVVSNNDKLGWVHLTSAAGKVVNTSHLVLANAFAASAAGFTNPDVYTHKPFTISLTITDFDSKKSGKVTFSGLIDGSVSLFNSSLKLTLVSSATARLHLGVHIYAIQLDNLTAPGPPNASSSGGIDATVTVSHNPEPSGIALALTGVGALVLRRWKRRRAA